MKTRKDLIVLTADSTMKYSIETLLAKRQVALGVHIKSYQVIMSPRHDPDCRLRGPQFLSGYAEQYHHGLIMFDWEGCGEDTKNRITVSSPDQLEERLREELRRTKWEDRADVFIFRPELEVWLWSDSNHKLIALRSESLSQCKSWLQEHRPDLWPKDSMKPTHPKEALKAVREHLGAPNSSAIHGEIAQHVTFRNCGDSSFLRFRQILQSWYSQNSI
jgi:hypothetical protein